MKEVWKAVVGYEGLYEVSDKGRVRSSITKKIKTPTALPSGYLCVWLYNGGKATVKNKLVSRLVTEAFHGAPPTPRHHAAHFDGNRSNNRLNNLRWATPKENEKDKIRHGTKTIRRGEAVGRGLLTRVDVERVFDLRVFGCTQKEIASWVGTCHSNVAYILQKRTWAHV